MTQSAPRKVTATRPQLAEVVLRPVRAHHAFEACVEQLGTAIRLGAFEPGSSLPPERELARMLGISRATLREAIAALRTAGLVQTRRGRGGGTVIRRRSAGFGLGIPISDIQRSPERVADSLAFRRMVEPGASHLAASREVMTTHRQLLVRALEDVSAATARAAHRQADARLHLALARASESPLIFEAVTKVQSDLDEMLNAIPVLEPNIEHSNVQHRAIVDAVLHGEPLRARREMERHCDDTAALLRGLLGYTEEGTR